MVKRGLVDRQFNSTVSKNHTLQQNNYLKQIKVQNIIDLSNFTSETKKSLEQLQQTAICCQNVFWSFPEFSVRGM